MPLLEYFVEFDTGTDHALLQIITEFITNQPAVIRVRRRNLPLDYWLSVLIKLCRSEEDATLPSLALSWRNFQYV